ncbi:ABC transporter permease [Arthrobacter pigmenti]
MGSYLAKRLLLLLPTIFVPVLLVFFMMQLAPGDPAAVMLGSSATPEQVADLREELGLDEPLWSQFFIFCGNLLTLQLGNSIFLGQPVIDIVFSYGVVTVQLTLFALALAVLMGCGAGILAALFHNRVLDKVTMFMAVTAVGIPEFWLALLLILAFSVTLRWFPVSGYVPPSEGFFEFLLTMTLPAFALALIQAAFIARMSRSAVLDVMGEQYISTARAKGLDRWTVVSRHVVRAASVPIVTVVGLTSAVLLGGAVAVETVFSLPGIGNLLIQAVARRDYPLIQGIVLVVAVAFVVINLLIDLVYAMIDPRVRYE